MEDIDPPREQPDADKLILDCLTAHGLEWDKTVLFQSQQTEAYRTALAQLSEKALSYRCNCTRARLKSLKGRYDRHCIEHPPSKDEPAAVKLNLPKVLATLKHHSITQLNTFIDGILGQQYENLQQSDDFVIHRKDGLFAYQLAVVVDDIAQNISHVVRGADLLSTTIKQQLLFFLFGAKPPAYSHIPLITDTNGNKLSKQNHAPPVNTGTPEKNLIKACRLLYLSNDHSDYSNLHQSSVNDILTWATQQWNIKQLAKQSAAVQSAVQSAPAQSVTVQSTFTEDEP